MLDPVTASLIAGTVSSLFGKKPKYTEGQKLQLDVARQMQRMGNSAPLSSADELTALAQQRALLGNEQQIATGQVLGAMPAYARTNTTDLMRNLASSQAGERSALDLQAIAESIARNRQALLSAGQLAGGVGAPAQPGRGNDIPAIMGQLAQTYFQQQAMKQANQQGQGGGGQPGGSIWPQTAQVGGRMAFPGMGGGPVAQSTPKPPAVSTGPQSGLSGFLGAWGGILNQPGVTMPGPFPVQTGPVPSQNVAAALTPPSYNINGMLQQPPSAPSPMPGTKRRKRGY